MPLSPAEWDDVAALPFVRESWGLEGADSGSELAAVAYGVRFDYGSACPGWCGELFVIVGDVIGNPPLLLAREQRAQELRFVDYGSLITIRGGRAQPASEYR